MTDISEPSGHDGGSTWGKAAAVAKDKLRVVAEQQKSKAADEISGVASTVEGAAKDLGRQMPHAAEYIEDMSKRLGSAAAALRERSVDDLIRTAGAFARQRPGVFFAGAVLAGLALSRFLKSSNLEARG
jgi:hypothetical protein